MSLVECKREDNIAVISINRPEALNALSRQVVDEIDTIIEDIKKDNEIRCVILYSEKNFAAGADIKDMANCDEEEAKAFAFSSTFNKISQLKIPVIAAIEGFALGGGMEYALTADIRIASAGAKMGFPEVTLGIFPGAGGTIRVPKLCGKAFASELIFTGDMVEAERALAFGMVNEVVDYGTTFQAAMKMAKRIAKRGPVAIRMAKEVIRKGLCEPDEIAAVAIETEEWPRLFATEDQKEGMKAFIEKRKPQFHNK